MQTLQFQVQSKEPSDPSFFDDDIAHYICAVVDGVPQEIAYFHQDKKEFAFFVCELLNRFAAQALANNISTTPEQTLQFMRLAKPVEKERNSDAN